MLFIALHLALSLALAFDHLGHFPDILNITRDWSLGEMLNYVKWVFLIAILLLADRRRSRPLFLSLGLFFIIALADDSLQLHEWGGGRLVMMFHLNLVYGSLAFQAGELVIWALLGGIGIAIVAIGWRKSDAATREQAKPLFTLFAAILFCAIGVDIIHSLLPHHSIIAGLFGVLEDGGEMLLITALLSYTFGTLQPFAQPDARVKT